MTAWPSGSVIRNPGCTPLLLPAETCQPVSVTRSTRSGPLTMAGTPSSFWPMRLMNQLESGTSSTVCTHVAALSGVRDALRDEADNVRYPARRR